MGMDMGMGMGMGMCVGGIRRWCVAVGVDDVEQLLISVAHTKLLIQLFTLFLAADNKKPRTHLRVLFREKCCRCCCCVFPPKGSREMVVWEKAAPGAWSSIDLIMHITMSVICVRSPNRVRITETGNSLQTCNSCNLGENNNEGFVAVRGRYR